MTAILYLLFWSTYLLASIGLAWWVSYMLRPRRGFKLAGIFVFLLMIGAVLWDAPLQEWEYRRLCREEAGLTIFKTPEEWDAENGGVLKSLTPNPSVRGKEISRGYTRYVLNEIFAWDYIVTPKVFGLTEYRDEIIDLNTNNPVVRYVDFEANKPRAGDFIYRLWMIRLSCEGVGRRPLKSKFIEIKSGFTNFEVRS